jgi:hypothetical protein
MRRRRWYGDTVENTARMNKLIDEDSARRYWAGQRAERHPGDAAYAKCTRDGCQERAAGGAECTNLCARAAR